MAKTFQNDNEKMSYAMGLNVAEYVANAPVGLTPELVLEGLKDALAGTPGIPAEEYAEAMQMLQTRMRDAARDQAKNAGEAHAKAGKEFLAANKTKEGVGATATGLQYQVLQEGKGAKPQKSSKRCACPPALACRGWSRMAASGFSVAVATVAG